MVFLFLLAIAFCSKKIEKKKIFSESDNETVVLEHMSKDYAQYVNKIWVMEQEINVDERLICSFYITSIEENKIEGKFSRIQTVQRDHYLYGKESEPVERAYQGNFSGYIVGETAECDFDDGRGFVGKINMDFQDNLIRAEIIVDKEISRTDWFDRADFSGQYSFIPWNLAQETSFLPTKELNATSDYWGNIWVVTGEMTERGKKYPCIFITDSNKDILYQFNLGYDSKLQISNIKLDDLNQDGLADIGISTDQGMCSFYQSRDGSFAEEWEGNEKIDVENYLYKKWFSRAESDENVDGIQFSLYFTQLSKDQVGGRICIGNLAGSECFPINCTHCQGHFELV